MKPNFETAESYIEQISDDKRNAFEKLRNTILDRLPNGFEETMNYGMIGYLVPKSIYPNGYHSNPKLPLPFVNIGCQKNYFVLHHLGLYANPKLLEWFVNEYPNHSKTKLDMGKGCVRFKKIDEIPHELIGLLMEKISVSDWISMYENSLKK